MPELTEHMKYSTLLESVKYSLFRAIRFNCSDMVAPAAILWTDADSQWEPLVSQLRQLMPELLLLGEYKPDEKTGPAIWLRCVIERSLPDIDLPEDAIPIIYVPNVSRQTLRAVEECPDSLKPLVELQYRGAVWTQRNGRDWTVEAFLVSKDGGLGLDVSKDRHTRHAMIGALRDLLVWINSPSEIQEQWDENKWTALAFGRTSGGGLKNHHCCIPACRKCSENRNPPGSSSLTKNRGLMKTTMRKNHYVRIC